MESPDKPAVEVDGVSAAYGARRVLDGLDLHVVPGEIVAMLGHNGAGKTTALRVIAGLKAPSSGRVRLHGADVKRMSTSARARSGLALVPEGVSGLFPSLTVRQNLQAVLPASDGSDSDAVLAVLRESFREVLVDRIDQEAGSMSGGQRQMLALALALIRRPTVLLLDEPSTGLAPVVVDRIFNVVAETAKQAGTATLIVEQDVASAVRIASRVVVLQAGRLVADFPREECPPATELWRLF